MCLSVCVFYIIIFFHRPLININLDMYIYFCLHLAHKLEANLSIISLERCCGAPMAGAELQDSAVPEVTLLDTLLPALDL